ncbi:MAG: MgtC/SapB family protein [Pseudarthrobacter sp.]
MDTVDMIARVCLGLGLGAMVGLERQWRARLAGLRTNALVSLGSTLFVLFSVSTMQGTSGDPTRMAAQIVSGIGFLGAGVIMKHGASISGLNTAATLWATAAIGALAGSGMWQLAIIGTIAIMITNTLLRPIGRLMDKQPGTTLREPASASYVFRATCHDAAEAHIRALVVQAVTRTEFRLHSVESFDVGDGLVRVQAAVTALERDDRLLESAVSRLSLEPHVTTVSWAVDENEGVVLE